MKYMEFYHGYSKLMNDDNLCSSKFTYLHRHMTIGKTAALAMSTLYLKHNIYKNRESSLGQTTFLALTVLCQKQGSDASAVRRITTLTIYNNSGVEE
ncbi:hypothetical protein KSX_31900 [Ktedonospora formicarum]|uniref:Uncharacterized protein n=1 Tax=Ktedonospora formicarum TaxID=2778364 RepID=A0A8J3MQL3_9CHLR|nr:hypothetical protein KSX_31900 [Ktedonospora formicarum]